MSDFAFFILSIPTIGLLFISAHTYGNANKAAPYLSDEAGLFLVIGVIVTAVAAGSYFVFLCIATVYRQSLNDFVPIGLLLMSIVTCAAGLFLITTEDEVGRGYVARYLESAAGIQAEKDRIAAERVAEEERQARIAVAEAAKLKVLREAEEHRQEYEAKQRFKAADFDIRETKYRNEKREEEMVNEGASANGGGWAGELRTMIPRVERMVYEVSRDGGNPIPLRKAAEALKEALKQAA